MDSSSVLACAVRASGAKQHAWSAVYDDATYDESAEIRSILDETAEAWHPVRVGTPDLAHAIPRLIAANDEPVATATWLSHDLLCEKAAEAGFGSLFGAWLLPRVVRSPVWGRVVAGAVCGGALLYASGAFLAALYGGYGVQLADPRNRSLAIIYLRGAGTTGAG